MGLVLRLVETGAGTRGRGIDLMESDRPGDLHDIANLGLTPPEAKQLLARAQQAVVAVQARDHAALRPECLGCGTRCHKGERHWQVRVGNAEASKSGSGRCSALWRTPAPTSRR